MAVVNEYKFYGKTVTAAESNNLLEPGDNETIIVKSGSEQDVDVETGDNKESLTPVLVSTGSNDSEVSDLLYNGG